MIFLGAIFRLSTGIEQPAVVRGFHDRNTPNPPRADRYSRARGSRRAIYGVVLAQGCEREKRAA
jgi:hypothetical protein